MASEGAVILSYQDTLLRESDVALLDGCSWLNDNLIAFWFEYLEYDLYKDQVASVAFISPQVAHYIKAGQKEDIQNMLQSLELHTKHLIFLPINNHVIENSTGGSHWSLLVYRKKNLVFEHYDSCSGSGNKLHAEDVSKKLMPLLLDYSKDSHINARVIEVECTQQQNSYNCGVHVICNSEAICRKEFRGDTKCISEIASPEAVRQTRMYLKNLIASLRLKSA